MECNGTLSNDTTRIIKRLASPYWNFNKLPTDRVVAWNDLLLHKVSCSVRAVKLTNSKVPHEGDILIGFYALEPIEFTMNMKTYLPFHVHFYYQSIDPEAFQPIKHTLKSNQFSFACTRNKKDYVMNLIGMRYHDLELIDISCGKFELYCLYGYLQTTERLKIADMRQPTFYVCPSIENRMASKIQRQWRECVSNPSYQVCRSRLKREVTECYFMKKK